jgi:hypothetical protein
VERAVIILIQGSIPPHESVNGFSVVQNPFSGCLYLKLDHGCSVWRFLLAGEVVFQVRSKLPDGKITPIAGLVFPHPSNERGVVLPSVSNIRTKLFIVIKVVWIFSG